MVNHDQEGCAEPVFHSMKERLQLFKKRILQSIIKSVEEELSMTFVGIEHLLFLEIAYALRQWRRSH
jgi:hypothetical protein